MLFAEWALRRVSMIASRIMDSFIDEGEDSDAPGTVAGQHMPPTLQEELCRLSNASKGILVAQGMGDFSSLYAP